MDTEYNKMEDKSPLRSYAFLGGPVHFTRKLEYLANVLAEYENWYYDSGNPNLNEEQKNVGVLYQYIHHTFSKAKDDGKIIETSTDSIMNTGLLTNNGEEIFMLFERNTRIDAEPWYFKGFFRSSAHEIPQNLRGRLPKVINYFENCPEMLYFNMALPILPSFDHIIDERLDRLPSEIRGLDKSIITNILSNAQENMRMRVSRNHTLIVPQYYNKTIMYLAPLRIGQSVVPLAIEKHEQSYRVNTIFTPDMAYCNARLIMKPESTWLINSGSKSK